MRFGSGLGVKTCAVPSCSLWGGELRKREGENLRRMNDACQGPDSLSDKSPLALYKGNRKRYII